MSGPVIGTEPCTRCGGTMRYTESEKSGGISGSCDGCKRQTFDRSPKAVNGLKKRLAGSKGNGASASEKKEPAGQGEAFSIEKL